MSSYSEVAWDPRWSLRAPGAPGSSPTGYAVWKRRVQALLEAESVWEVVSEGVSFDEAWPLAKQLEFIAKDKRGMHLILSAVNDALVAQLIDCDRSWLMLQRLEGVFAAHRMVAVRAARRSFLDLRFNEEDVGGEGAGGNRKGPVVDDGGAMQRFIDRVQEKADALARLRDGAVSGDEDEMMFQLLDALPASWASFIALECETLGDLTWSSVKRKVLLEYSRRRVEGSRRSVRAVERGVASTPLALAVAGSSSSSAGNGPPPEQESGEGAEEGEVEGGANGSESAAFASPALGSPALAAKSEPDRDDQYGEDSPGEDETIMFDFAGAPYPPPQAMPPQQQYQQYQQGYHHVQAQDPYYEQNARGKFANKNPPFARPRRDRDAPFQRTMPYSRPPNQVGSAQNKMCYYCSMMGHTAHLCPLKRLHMEERKKNQQQQQQQQ